MAGEFAEAGVKRIGTEATGGYELACRHFAGGKLHRRRAAARCPSRPLPSCICGAPENDRIDAILIAACAVAKDAQNKLPPDPRFAVLTDHHTFIDEVEDGIVRCKIVRAANDTRLRRCVMTDIARPEKRCAAELQRLIGAMRG